MPGIALRRLSVVLSGTLLLGLAGAGCRRHSAGADAGAGERRVQPVEVAPVQRRDMSDVLSLVGSIEANESAAIRPEISGIVRDIAFQEGHAVKKGDALLTIDDSALRAERAEIEARHQLARANSERANALIRTNSISRAELDAAEAETRRLKALLDLTDVRLEKTSVRAPFDGMVGARSISPGDLVTPEMTITTIEDLNRLKVTFSVPERHLHHVQIGGKFRLSTTARASRPDGAAPVSGGIYFVSPVIDPSTRAATVKGILDEPPEGIRPGMFATVELVLVERRGVLTVPEAALLGSARGMSVVAVRKKDGGHVAELVPVRTGLRELGFVEVTPVDENALTEGTAVVAAGVGALALFPGTPVEPGPLKMEIEKRGTRI
jgi:membrane fusion protein (multidrug efflux system)